jgi:hypothetical protein
MTKLSYTVKGDNVPLILTVVLPDLKAIYLGLVLFLKGADWGISGRNSDSENWDEFLAANTTRST